MAVLLKCPDCKGKFKWVAATEKWPKHCPLCGEFMGMTEEQELNIPMPFLRSAKTTANDKLYRDMEKGSEVRVEKAAEMAGCSPADMGSLKITNLNDRKDTEIAAMPVQNAVTQHMEAMNQRGGQFGFGASGSEWAAGVSDGSVTIDGKVTKGIAPRAGANTLGRIQSLHGRG